MLNGMSVSNTLEGQRTEITVWVDTAFNGGLVIPKRIVFDLKLPKFVPEFLPI